MDQFQQLQLQLLVFHYVSFFSTQQSRKELQKQRLMMQSFNAEPIDIKNWVWNFVSCRYEWDMSMRINKKNLSSGKLIEKYSSKSNWMVVWFFHHFEVMHQINKLLLHSSQSILQNMKNKIIMMVDFFLFISIFFCLTKWMKKVTAATMCVMTSPTGGTGTHDIFMRVAKFTLVSRTQYWTNLIKTTCNLSPLFCVLSVLLCFVRSKVLELPIIECKDWGGQTNNNNVSMHSFHSQLSRNLLQP